MSDINPNCEGSHCRPGYKEVRRYPMCGGGTLYLCLPCFANEQLYRYMRAKETGHPDGWSQVSWATAEVTYDKHGERFDAEAVVRQGIVNYYQNNDGDDNE